MDIVAPLIVAIDHPSLEGAVHRFGDELRAEPRFFGPSADPKPFPSLIRRLTMTDGLRIGAMIDGRLIAISRLENNGEFVLAVAADWRSRGVGGWLLRTTAARAAEQGWERIVLRSSRRSRAVAALGDSVGATTVDLGQGRIELIFSTAQVAQRLALA